jgi:hypothetical protein
MLLTSTMDATSIFTRIIFALLTDAERSGRSTVRVWRASASTGLYKLSVWSISFSCYWGDSTYIEWNQGFIPNYGERYRHGERISTGFVESTVNQVVSKRMVKKQQMQWSKRGAHLLLQIRTRVLNGEWEETFRTWYPGFRSHTQPLAA